MTTTVYGTKYAATKDLNTTEIAKLFRADVKAAIKAGELPKGLKLSVRTSYYSGGSSITVEIVAAPGIEINNPERVEWDLFHPHETGAGLYPLRSEAALAIEAKLEKLLGEYNYDGSDSMTDYFHVRFYGRVTWDWELVAAEKETIVAALKANGGKWDPREAIHVTAQCSRCAKKANAYCPAEHKYDQEPWSPDDDKRTFALSPSTCKPLPPFPKTFPTYVPELDATDRPRSVNTLTGAVTYHETTKEVLEGLDRTMGKVITFPSATRDVPSDPPTDPLVNYLATEGDYEV